jgi:hypothetical protein
MRQFATILSAFAILFSSNGCKPSRSGLSEEMTTSSTKEWSSQTPLPEESTKYFINLMSNFNDGPPPWQKSLTHEGMELMGAVFVNWTHKQEGYLVINPSWWTKTGIFIPTMKNEMQQKFKKFFKMVVQSEELPLGYTKVSCMKESEFFVEVRRCAVQFQKL